ncbi:isoflavone reductase family protein [Xylariomycetidae sp. FL2044]|nr:isoflavone reductase family protein [Xylariomycetidae sp. FL2044]
MTEAASGLVPPAKRILIIGATGLIGKFITTALIKARSNFDRIGILTSETTLASKSELIGKFRRDGVEIFAGDIDDDDQVLKAYDGFDTVVSAVGRNAIDKQINLVRLAESFKTITRFIPSEYGTDIEYNDSSAHETPHQKKLKVRAYIKSSASRLRFTYLVTGPFADFYLGNNVSQPQIGSFDPRNSKATLLGDGNGQISLTTMEDVGRLLVAVLLHPEVSDNRILKVNSYTTTPHEILAEFERQTGSKWDVSYTSMRDLKRYEQAAWQDGNPLAAGYTLKRIWTEGGTLYERTDNADLGMKSMDTLEMSVQQAVWSAMAAFQRAEL